jgi:hypothetical protein
LTYALSLPAKYGRVLPLLRPENRGKEAAKGEIQ